MAHEGRDGKVRSVQVKIRSKLYERPINKIVHLELGTVDCGATVTDEINDCSEPLPAPTEPPERRPVRAVAKKAAEVRKDLISQGQLIVRTLPFRKYIYSFVYSVYCS